MLATRDEPHVTHSLPLESAPKGWQLLYCAALWHFFSFNFLSFELSKKTPKNKSYSKAHFPPKGEFRIDPNYRSHPAVLSSASKPGGLGQKTQQVTHVQPENLSSSSTHPSYFPLNRKAAVTSAKQRDKPREHHWAPGLRVLLCPCPRSGRSPRNPKWLRAGDHPNSISAG